VIKDEI